MMFIKSPKLHLLVGLGVGLWLVVFLIFIAPFDVSELSFSIRVKITSVYGSIFFLAYALCIPVQNIFFQRFEKWSWKLEVLIYLFLNLITLPLTILYYKSGIVNGDYPVLRFILEQYIPIFVIISPIMFLLRRAVAKKGKSFQQIESNVTIKGDNKNDLLKVRMDKIVCIGSSDNYVEVHYLDHEMLKKKLIRTTLKKAESQLSFMVRSHRSYLINPMYFVEWINKDLARINNLEIPVSKQYKDNVLKSVRP